MMLNAWYIFWTAAFPINTTKKNSMNNVHFRRRRWSRWKKKWCWEAADVKLLQQLLRLRLPLPLLLVVVILVFHSTYTYSKLLLLSNDSFFYAISVVKCEDIDVKMWRCEDCDWNEDSLTWKNFTHLSNFLFIYIICTFEISIRDWIVTQSSPTISISHPHSSSYVHFNFHAKSLKSKSKRSPRLQDGNPSSMIASIAIHHHLNDNIVPLLLAFFEANNYINYNSRLGDEQVIKSSTP